VFTPYKALESIVLRMPSEITPFLGTIIQVGTKYIKFDPVSRSVSLLCMRLNVIKNYAGGGDDGDEEMLDEDDDVDGDLDE
jgi:cullin-associated NEDD8-dissociated protein 1